MGGSVPSKQPLGSQPVCLHLCLPATVRLAASLYHGPHAVPYHRAQVIGGAIMDSTHGQ